MTHPVIPVVVLDELVARPGCAAEVIAAYRSDYVPTAVARGMRLLHEWVSPPTLLPDGCNTLLVAWQVDGVEGWWQGRAGGRDPEVVDFWARVAPLLTARSRRSLAAPDDLAGLEDVL